MLWKRLSVPSGLALLMQWQVTQRALPLNSTQPCCASAEMASVVAGEEAVERRVEEDQRALEGGDGARRCRRSCGAGRTPPGTCAGTRGRRRSPATAAAPSGWPISIGLMIGSFACSSSVAARPSQELRLQNEGVHRRRRVAPAELVADALGHRPLIGEAAAHVVAGRAGDGAVGRQPRVEVELLPERDALGRHLVVGRHQHAVPEHRVRARRRLGQVAITLMPGEALLLALHLERAVRVLVSLGACM